jgi:hypothetical protein
MCLISLLLTIVSMVKIGDSVGISVIKSRGVEDSVMISDKTPEGMGYKHVEDLCPKCKIGRVIPTEDPEIFKCTHCRFRRIVPSI